MANWGTTNRDVLNPPWPNFFFSNAVRFGQHDPFIIPSPQRDLIDAPGDGFGLYGRLLSSHPISLRQRRQVTRLSVRARRLVFTPQTAFHPRFTKCHFAFALARGRWQRSLRFVLILHSAL